MEVNPDHPVTQSMHDNWHKFAALIMWKLKIQKITITVEDLEQFSCLPDVSMPTIIAHHHKEAMDFLLMPLDQANVYVEKHQAEGGQIG